VTLDEAYLFLRVSLYSLMGARRLVKLLIRRRMLRCADLLG
jgi:hypothetical protein